MVVRINVEPCEEFPRLLNVELTFGKTVSGHFVKDDTVQEEFAKFEGSDYFPIGQIMHMNEPSVKIMIDALEAFVTSMCGDVTFLWAGSRSDLARVGDKIALY